MTPIEKRILSNQWIMMQALAYLGVGPKLRDDLFAACRHTNELLASDTPLDLYTDASGAYQTDRPDAK
jgi:hypothetical protein